MMGNSLKASAKGNVISKNLWSSVSVGVKPACPNQAAANAVVKPIIKILIATQDTTWSPLCVTDAQQCNLIQYQSTKLYYKSQVSQQSLACGTNCTFCEI